MFSRSILRVSALAGRQLATRGAIRHASTTSTNATSRTSKFLVSGGVAVAAATAFGVSVTAMDASEAVDEAKVRDAIADILADTPTLGGTLVRLAWHASGTYDKATGTGGSNGAGMRFSPEADWGANAGLHVARNALEPVKRKFPNMSYSDLWTLAGVVAISEMGGPEIGWRGGRTDVNDGSNCVPDGRLPNADMGSQAATIQHVRDIFYRMGFNDQEIVALVGAHAVGRCHTEFSGYWGPWTRAETTFSSEYFRELLENTWTIKKWKGPEQYEDPTGDLMMLPADMALVWDPVFKKHVEAYAKDEDKFFKDFASAFQRLQENGCGFPPLKSGWFSWLGF